VARSYTPSTPAFTEGIFYVGRHHTIILSAYCGNTARRAREEISVKTAELMRSYRGDDTPGLTDGGLVVFELHADIGERRIPLLLDWNP
jgi:hypothetical protein